MKYRLLSLAAVVFSLLSGCAEEKPALLNQNQITSTEWRHVEGVDHGLSEKISQALASLNNPNGAPSVAGLLRDEKEPGRWDYLKAGVPQLPSDPDNLRAGYHAKLLYVDGEWIVEFSKK